MNNSSRFILLVIMYFIFIGGLLILKFASGEGTLGNNAILNFIADYLFFPALPAILFMFPLAKTGMRNIEYFSISVFILAFLYALITNYFIIKNNKKKKKEAEVGSNEVKD